ncbi:plasma membrane ascorbate-dependent reductase CYBRD1 [Neosynchiropus ocellatus]
MEKKALFVGLLSAAVVLGIAAIIFVLVWVIQFREGLGWDGRAAEFNWHPVLMVIGFVFLQGTAIIVYRLPWTWQYSKQVMKFVHAGLNMLAFILVVVSLVAVFDFHNVAQIPNMYSLHSWVGLIAVILYSLQLVLGICFYLIPTTPVSWRTAYMPIHVFSGRMLFGSVVAVSLMGITEKLIFALDKPKYKDSPPEATFVNVLGLLLVVFGAIILWIATRESWKRPNEQTQHILQGQVEGYDSTKIQPSLSLSEEAGGDVRRRKLEDPED